MSEPGAIRRHRLDGLIRAAKDLRAGLAHRMFQGAMIFSAGLAIEYAAQFARSVTLTRQLGPTEFGIASSMVILATLIDMSTGLGADRYLIQAKDGDGKEALAVAHTLTLGRAALSAALLAALAWPTAKLLGVPQAAGSFYWLAAIPLLRGFAHLRVDQLQRGYQFWPGTVANASANLVGLAAVVCASLLLHDHRAVLWGLGAQAVGLVCATHGAAGIPYRFSFQADAMRRALRFGIPLMLNGLALAALGQFDRLAVGSFLDVAQLGRYGLATMMFYMPTSLLFRVTFTVAQPRLSAAWHESPLWEFPHLFQRMSMVSAAIGALAAAAVATFGDAILSIVFGARFAVGDLFFAIFSLAVFMRFARQMANFGGLAAGRTRDLMLSNLSGALGLAVTVVGLWLTPALFAAAGGMLAGEALGTIVAFARLDRHLRVSANASYTAFLAMLSIPGAVAAWVLLGHPSIQLRMAVLGSLMICLALGTRRLYNRKQAQTVGSQP